MNELIFGKQNLQKIVSIEPNDNSVEIFYENSPGVISSEIKPHKYWLLSSQKLDDKFSRLKGNLNYCYGRQYISREEFVKQRSYYRHKDMFSIWNAKESCAVKDGYSCFLEMQPEDVSLLSFDLETTGLDPHAKDAKILLISITYRAGEEKYNYLLSYDQFSSQKELIEEFCSKISAFDPSILLGHNIFGFDLHYLNVMAKKYNTILNLGRDGSEAKFDNYEKKFRVDGTRDLHYNNCLIYGREIVDTMFLSIRADISRKYNSYGLKKIIEQEGWELSGRTFYDASKIRLNFTNPIEWEKIKKYCQDDALDAITLYDKFIPPFFYMNQSVAKGGFQNLLQSATGSQLNTIMMRAYLQQGYSLPKADLESKFEGAISEGFPGIYNNCLKLDISSLYPSIMVEYGIFPKDKDPFEYFPFLVKYFREERLKNKALAKSTGQDYYSHLEQSQKISINSLYGFLGAPGLLFNYVEGAAEVTRRGRGILSKGMDIVKSYNFKIANVDTDAILFCRQDENNMLEGEKQGIQTIINNAFPDNISWEFDGYFPKVVILKAKNYILKDENGKVKYKGSALRDPKIEPALREFIEKIVNCLLNDKNDYEVIYKEYIKEILSISDIKRWSVRKTISSKTLESERTNESKIRDAIEGTEYVEGDRVHVFFKNDKSLGLMEKFDGDYDKKVLLSKLYKTGQRFETVLNSKDIFKNYSLKRNQEELSTIC